MLAGVCWQIFNSRLCRVIDQLQLSPNPLPYAFWPSLSGHLVSLFPSCPLSIFFPPESGARGAFHVCLTYLTWVERALLLHNCASETASVIYLCPIPIPISLSLSLCLFRELSWGSPLCPGLFVLIFAARFLASFWPKSFA